MRHFAAELIRKPYEEGKDGPDSFDCWGLVRYVFRTHLHIDMPVVATKVENTPENVGAIKRAARVSGWRRVKGNAPEEFDIVTMDGLDGRHVGLIVKDNHTTLLLHCLERIGVCAQPILDLGMMGFRGLEYWRNNLDPHAPTPPDDEASDDGRQSVGIREGNPEEDQTGVHILGPQAQ